MGKAAFIETFGDIYEHSSWIASQAFDSGLTEQHDDITQLHGLMMQVLAQASDQAKLALINAHPDLAGKAAVAGELTAASTSEQAGAGIHLCTADEFARFNQLNEAYKARFEFPFIMAVKGSDRHQIIAAFEVRIHNDRATELAQALNEINKIALFRLREL